MEAPRKLESSEQQEREKNAQVVALVRAHSKIFNAKDRYDPDTDDMESPDKDSVLMFVDYSVPVREAHSGEGSQELRLNASGDFSLVTRFSPDNWNPDEKKDILSIDDVFARFGRNEIIEKLSQPLKVALEGASSEYVSDRYDFDELADRSGKSHEQLKAELESLLSALERLSE